MMAGEAVGGLWLPQDDGSVPVALEADVFKAVIRKAAETPHVGSMPDHQNLARGQIAGGTDQSGDRIDWPMPAFPCCRSMKNIK